MPESFRNQSFANRFAAMGDQSEGIFDLVHTKSHPLGLNRPNFTMRNMTPEMRYTPDRMTSDKLWEVMGFGTDQKLKIKVEKIEALLKWKEIGPTWLFIYDSKNHRYWEASLDAWHAACVLRGTLDSFPEGKEYYALTPEHFPTTPKDAPPLEADTPDNNVVS